MCFSTIETFENTIQYLKDLDEISINEWENHFGLSSLRKLYTDSNMTSVPYFDEVLFSVLNENCEVAVNNYYFKLDFETYKLKVVDFSSSNLKSVNNSSGIIFSFEDEVFEILEGNKKSIAAACASNSTPWATMNGLVNGHTQYRMRYLKAGIYYSLTATIEEMDGITWMQVYFSDQSDCYINPNNRPDYEVLPMQDEGTESAEIKPYSSTRKLVDYSWNVIFGSSSFNSSWVPNNDYYEETASLNCN